MYIDNLTLTGVVIFVVAVGLVVRFCMCGLCGGPRQPDESDHAAE